MDKDRDISRTIITPKKVGFVGSAVLVGSAFLAACGGGAKSATTPEGGVKGEAANPGGGSSPIVVKTEAMPSATAVQEAPTATVEASLTQDQIMQITTDYKTLIDGGLAETPVTTADLSKLNDPTASNEMLDPAYLSKQLSLCDMSRYGQRLGPPDVSRSIGPGERGYSGIFANACAAAANVSKVLYEVTGNAKFKQANAEWKPVNKQIFGEIIKDPNSGLTAANWTSYENLYYIKGE